MTREWFLLEGTYQNQEISEICLDALSAMEQFGEKQTWTKERMEESIKNCTEFLKEFKIATNALRSEITAELFLLNLADKMCREMNLRPEELIKKIERAIDDLDKNRATHETWILLSKLMEVTQQTAMRKWGLMKPTF